MEKVKKQKERRKITDGTKKSRLVRIRGREATVSFSRRNETKRTCPCRLFFFFILPWQGSPAAVVGLSLCPSCFSCVPCMDLHGGLSVGGLPRTYTPGLSAAWSPQCTTGQTEKNGRTPLTITPFGNGVHTRCAVCPFCPFSVRFLVLFLFSLQLVCFVQEAKDGG